MPKFSTIARDIIEASLERPVQTKEDFLRSKRRLAGEARKQMPSTAELRHAYGAIIAASPEKKSLTLEKQLTRRDIRSLSGVAIVTVLTKPYPCPGKCVYCPTEAIMPKSYLSNEPAAMRALANEFDPYRQVASRIRALKENGHSADKIELIVKGGTWSAYVWEYRQWFLKRVFDACNQYGRKKPKRSASLAAAQKINESADYRVIGLTLETRPDWISVDEIVRLRELGCTRVELGVQSVDDETLKLSKRGHDVASVVRAARLLKDAGYKTDFHMMLQLPGATPKSDIENLRRIFREPRFRPDMIKIYPCVVIELAELHSWWKDGRYRPYSNHKIIDILIAAKQELPRYVRVSRLIRDIPSTSITAGNVVTNLREIIQARMRAAGLTCPCLRCREIGHAAKHDPTLLRARPVLFDDEYEASGGVEHFLSFEDTARRAVYAFCRLRLPAKRPVGESAELWKKISEIRETAFIRELHTYGHLVPIDTHRKDASQHKGLGKALMAEAERLARAAGYSKMAVISGVGVRGYYRKLGYRLQGTYMVKAI